jgi:glutamyl/glutaminyl-tRNA synthetase
MTDTRKNTRFYPTLNGECHLGHLYLGLLNYHRAKSLGGVMLVKSEFRLQYLPKNTDIGTLETWYKSFVEGFSFAGIEAEFMPLLHDGEWLAQQIETHKDLHGNDVNNSLYPKTNTDTSYHPFSPTWCFERVLLDNRYAVGSVIRGLDVISEFALYQYFCKQLNYTVPEHQYIKHISIKTGDETVKVSKTCNNASLRSIISSGVSKFQLLDYLTTACLKHPEEGWTLENTKKNIVLNLSELVK